MNLFQRAKSYQNLLPIERALLRFVQTFLMVTGPIGSIPLVHDLQGALTVVANGGAFPAIKWQGDLSWLVYALIVSFGLAVQKWHSASGDPALAETPEPLPVTLPLPISAKDYAAAVNAAWDSPANPLPADLSAKGGAPAPDPVPVPAEVAPTA